MSKTIPGVPESLTREQFTSLFTAVGIKPEDTKELVFRPGGIYATVYERTPEGRRLLHEDGSGCVTHEIFIPVIDEKQGA